MWTPIRTSASSSRIGVGNTEEGRSFVDGWTLSSGTSTPCVMRRKPDPAPRPSTQERSREARAQSLEDHHGDGDSDHPQLPGVGHRRSWGHHVAPSAPIWFACSKASQEPFAARDRRLARLTASTCRRRRARGEAQLAGTTRIDTKAMDPSLNIHSIVCVPVPSVTSEAARRSVASSSTTTAPALSRIRTVTGPTSVITAAREPASAGDITTR